MSAKINPVLCLSRVSFARVLEKYQNGHYDSLLKMAPLPSARAAPKVAVPLSTDEWSGVYKTRDRYDTPLVVATTGNDDLVRFMRTQELPAGGRCDFCKEDVQGTAVGIPRYVNEQLLLIDGKTRSATTFWTEGRFCCFECALACVHRNVEYQGTGTEANLRRMYRLQGNGGQLMPRHNTRLRLSEGGSLTDAEWKDTTTVYLNTMHSVCIPLKTEYLRK